MASAIRELEQNLKAYAFAMETVALYQESLRIEEEKLKIAEGYLIPKQLEENGFKRGDIRDLVTCHAVCKDVDYVLHQAALGSVPRSLEDPISTHAANNTGFLNMLVAARDAKVKRFVYAASSSTYGDHPGLPKVEDMIVKWTTWFIDELIEAGRT